MATIRFAGEEQRKAGLLALHNTGYCLLYKDPKDPKADVYYVPNWGIELLREKNIDFKVVNW